MEEMLLFGTEKGNTKRSQLMEEFDTKFLSGGVIDPLGAQESLE